MGDVAADKAFEEDGKEGSSRRVTSSLVQRREGYTMMRKSATTQTKQKKNLSHMGEGLS